ncbi:MAG: DegT/DnrJ/EryC1/StrS family aminotransferase, partial [Planctomycetes bacterium]|nr:DegT/DnrJ/EryC1/StrS family aminotransferase [Planctomycetota bacterium]
CHSLGASYKCRKVGCLADISCFSFHPVKPITTGEGGAAVTMDPKLASRVRLFRNHGITTDHRQRQHLGTWHYEMVDLGFNYRLSDIHCVLGVSQLRKLESWLGRRQSIARRYDEEFARSGSIKSLTVSTHVSHAYHLYVVRWHSEDAEVDRVSAFQHLRAAGLSVNVHYIPVHLHPFYRDRFGTRSGMCPVAETAYDQILSLPIFPSMSDSDVNHVIRESLLVADRCTSNARPSAA